MNQTTEKKLMFNIYKMIIKIMFQKKRYKQNCFI